jgi:hypothetical protein
MCDLFTSHVIKFGTSDDNTDAFWERFKITLKSEMSARNLLNQPTAFLNYKFLRSWDDPDDFDYLATECYVIAVLKPMDQLKALLNHNPSVAGAVRRNIKHFLIDRQRKGNPTGRKLFKNVETILTEAISRGDLTVQGASRGKLRNGTVLRLIPGDTRAPISNVDLERLIDNSEVWVQVIRTICGPASKAEQPLLDGLGEIRDGGVSAVRLGDLIAVIKKRADANLRPLHGSDETHEFAAVIRTILPDTRYEEDEHQNERIRRIRERIGRLDRGPKVKERILLVFDRLVALNASNGEIVWEDVYTAIGISKSTFWEYIHVVRSVVKEIEDEECD